MEARNKVPDEEPFVPIFYKDRLFGRKADGTWCYWSLFCPKSGLTPLSPEEASLSEELESGYQSGQLRSIFKR